MEGEGGMIPVAIIIISSLKDIGHARDLNWQSYSSDFCRLPTLHFALGI